MRNLSAAVLLLFASICLAQTAAPAPKVSAKAKAIHDAGVIVDTHADTPQNMLDDGYDLAQPNPQVHVNLEKAREGNLGAEFFSIWVEPGDGYKGHYIQRALDLIDAVYEQAAEHPDQMVMAYTADDIVKARTGPHKRLAALLGVEGGHAIDDDLHVLRDYYRLGVRYMTLTWSNTNEWADSSGDINDPKVQHHGGLTPFGKQVVLEMNRLGMMVDISHVADDTFWDAIKTSKAPVIASHSSARALANHPRNMTDDMLRAVAKNGGVVGVNFFSGFDDQNFLNAFSKLQPEIAAAVANAVAAYEKEHPGKPVPYSIEDRINREYAAKIPRPPLKSLIDNIDHIAKVAGWQHVGFGSDFDGVSGMTPEGIDSAADLPKITQALLDRGYTAAQIHAMEGGNLLRVMRQVEHVSREMQAKTPEPQATAATR